MKYNPLLEWFVRKIVPSAIVIDISPGGEFSMAIFNREEPALRSVKAGSEGMTPVVQEVFFKWFRLQNHHILYIGRPFLRVVSMRKKPMIVTNKKFE